jgi:hypothetical protein
VAYTCNPSYSGGRDQEVQDSKPAWGNSSEDSIQNKTNNNNNNKKTPVLQKERKKIVFRRKFPYSASSFPVHLVCVGFFSRLGLLNYHPGWL